MDLFRLIQGSYAMESLQEPLGISVKVQDVANEVEQTVNALEGEGHALQTIARYSTAEAGLPPQLCYLSDMEVTLIGTMQHLHLTRETEEEAKLK